MALWLGEATGAGRLVAVTAAQTVSVTHAAAAAVGLRSHPGSAASILHTCVGILPQIPCSFSFNATAVRVVREQSQSEHK